MRKELYDAIKKTSIRTTDKWRKARNKRKKLSRKSRSK